MNVKTETAVVVGTLTTGEPFQTTHSSTTATSHNAHTSGARDSRHGNDEKRMCDDASVPSNTTG